MMTIKAGHTDCGNYNRSGCGLIIICGLDGFCTWLLLASVALNVIIVIYFSKATISSALRVFPPLGTRITSKGTPSTVASRRSVVGHRHRAPHRHGTITGNGTGSAIGIAGIRPGVGTGTGMEHCRPLQRITDHLRPLPQQGLQTGPS